MLVDNVFWGSLDTYAATPGQLEVTIPLARLGQHTLEIRNRPERNKSAVPSSATSFKLEFVQMETLYDGQTLQYSYDDLSRLLAADYFAAWDDVNPVRDYTFGYDVAGNRTSEVVNVDGSPFSSQTHTYDAANRISSAGFAYNDAGQMTADDTLSYSWDRAGRLLGAGDSSYVYNGLGQRVQQTVSGVVTEYLLDVQPGLAKVIAAMTGANTERFVHERGLLSQQDSNGDWQWMVTDGLGSVRGVVDGTGFDPAYSVHYAPYGQPWGEQGTEQTPFGFTGEPTDDNGLVHLRARYYNPALGVFPSLDPVEGVLQQAMSLNRYAYVAGNVINAVDPSGQASEPPCGINLVADPPSHYCVDYDAAEAAQFAIDNAYPQSEITISYRGANITFCNYDRAGTGDSGCGSSDSTNCANFVSMALFVGGLPMHYNEPTLGRRGWTGLNEISDTDLSQLNNITHTEGWACIIRSVRSRRICIGTSAWRGANEMQQYMENIVSGPSYHTISSYPGYGGSLVDRDTTTGDVIAITSPTLEATLNDADFQKIEAGDVVDFPQASTPHVGIVVGWGSILRRNESDQLNALTIGDLSPRYDPAQPLNKVPYIADHGGQGLPARPYYYLRWDSITGTYIDGEQVYYKIPSTRCIPRGDFVDPRLA